MQLVGGLIDKWATDAGFFLYDRRVWVEDPCWANSRWHSLSYRSVDEFEYIYIFWKPGITTVDRSRLTKDEWRDWGSRGAWNFKSVRSHDTHESEFPLELPRRVIKLFSDPDDLVLDCFIGSGTSAEAAILEGRSYLGFDLVPENVKQARTRCSNAKERLLSYQPQLGVAE